MELKERVRALRKGTGQTQEQLADAGGLERVEVVNVESGRNQLTSVRVLRGLALGFGISVDDMIALVDGTLPVEDALARRGRQRSAGPVSTRAGATPLGEHRDWPAASAAAQEWTGIDPRFFDLIAGLTMPRAPSRLDRKLIAGIAEGLADAERRLREAGEPSMFDDGPTVPLPAPSRPARRGHAG